MKRSKFRYKRFSKFLKEKYGCRVYKIGINAGFSCPNRDGTISEGGCIFCNNEAFGRAEEPVKEQIEKGIKFTSKRYGAKKHIIYFQSYTNTYASPRKLEMLYGVIKDYDSVVGLSIGTRPDCIDDEKLDVIEKFCGDYDLWMEYGLQSTNNKTLDFINRGHSYSDFLDAVELTRKRRDIKISPHVIIGLPGEDAEDFKNTAREMGRLKVDGIKIHPLHVIRDTPLAKLYESGRFTPMSLEEYIDYAASFLEYLWSETVIQRITATCPEDMLLAPGWLNMTGTVINRVNLRLKGINSSQGRLFSEGDK